MNEQTNTQLTDDTVKQLLETIKRQNELYEQMLTLFDSKTKKSKVENRWNGLKFTKKEISLMPTAYRNIFAANDMIIHYRLRADGVYEARFHSKGIDIEVSSKDLTKLKQKFIDRLNNKDDAKKSKKKEKTFADYDVKKPKRWTILVGSSRKNNSNFYPKIPPPKKKALPTPKSG
ncbi:MAG: hypothetical protein NC132_02860 [Corallococcus sp.]|nr:hypothetical protein [Corallococcus sp.]MCM1359050.1 hypothetical protein [Corallococcus sp.]MCM1395039.1 hypothetical protein [Corallococcus sp.]